MKNASLDERAVDIAGGGVDLDAVDLAAAHLVAHHALVGAGIEHGQHTTARPHENIALVLEGDRPSQPAPVEASDHQDSTGETLLWLRFFTQQLDGLCEFGDDLQQFWVVIPDN